MRPRLPSTPEVAPLPESVRWHLVTRRWPARGQFADGWLAAFLLSEREKDELWAAHHAALDAEARARGWRRGARRRRAS